ncbi:MAG: metal ABC transporter permease [Armatimonadetes bacterium]|jgi:ABC-type Mn2+/Zn2+ transport system permease subunit|nr:metal ABC transporter permease [Armatimonadota bacterium]
MFASIQEAFGSDFMQHALLAGMAVGALCAYLGVYVVLKRIVFVGVALAEMSSAGVALALWTAGVLGLEMEEHNPLTMVGAVVLMLVGVLLFSVRWSARRVPPESTIGVGYAVAAAAGLLLMAHSAKGEAHVMQLLFGNILYVSVREIWEFLAAAAAVALVHLLFAKELLFVAFDPQTADAVGYRTRRWELLFYLTLGVTIAFAIRVAGVLLVFAMLVLPPVTALLLTRHLRRAFPVSAALGVLPVGIGLYLSYVRDVPSAACIVIVSFALLLAAGGLSLLRRA